MNSDFSVRDEGSLVAITPVSDDAQIWIEENVASEPWQWMGPALCLDHRVARDLLFTLSQAGFSISN